MPHSALLGDVEVPVTYWPDEAAWLLQEAGIVGAGGAGFPTYVKYTHPPRALVVNGAESEPGYYADKLLLRDEPEALVDVFQWLKRTFGMDVTILAVEEVAKPFIRDFERLARKLKSFSIAFIPPEYKLGQENALVHHVLGIAFARGERPLDHGVVVSNNETLFNVYRAVFEDRPVTTKFVHVYGELGMPRVFEAPVGTLAGDLFRIAGADPAALAHCRLYDGGPILADKTADPMGREPDAVVRKNTNALLVVDPAKDRPRKKWYPHEGHVHNAADCACAPRAIENVEDRVQRVRVPLAGTFWKSGPVIVHKGDEVQRGDVLAHPALEGLSVGTHASIPGTVTRVTNAFVEIRR